MKSIETIVKATLLTALLAGCKTAPEKVEAKPEFKPSALVDVGAHIGERHNLRTQGFISPFPNASLAFLHDATTAEALPLDSVDSYLQLRPNYDVIKTRYGNIGVIGMAELGNFEDRARLGISITPKTKDFFTQFRVFPLRSGQPGLRADNFSSASFLDGILSADLLTSYKKGYQANGENSLYVEPMFRCDIGRLTGVKALRGFYAGAVAKYSHNFRTSIGKGEFQAQVGYRLKLP